MPYRASGYHSLASFHKDDDYVQSDKAWPFRIGQRGRGRIADRSATECAP
jgi:hypothetical protein